MTGSSLTHGIPVRVDLFAGSLDPRAFAARHPPAWTRAEAPLVLAPGPGQFLVVTRFGAVISWSVDEALLAQALRDLGLQPKAGPLLEALQDRLTVRVGAPEGVDFNEVRLADLSLGRIRVVSLALARSAALDRLEQEVAEALVPFQPVVRALRSHGRLRPSHREALQLLGFALDVRSAVLGSLALFDAPPETWEDEALDRLHRALVRQLDLAERHAFLERRLAFLAEAGTTVTEALNSRTSHRMELIIIALIALETGVFIWKELLS